jgi:hypothetical protein
MVFSYCEEIPALRRIACTLPLQDQCVNRNQTGYIGRNEVNQSDLLVKQPQPKLILVNIHYVGSHTIRTVVCVFL